MIKSQDPIGLPPDTAYADTIVSLCELVTYQKCDIHLLTQLVDLLRNIWSDCISLYSGLIFVRIVVISCFLHCPFIMKRYFSPKVLHLWWFLFFRRSELCSETVIEHQPTIFQSIALRRKRLTCIRLQISSHGSR